MKQFFVGSIRSTNRTAILIKIVFCETSNIFSDNFEPHKSGWELIFEIDLSLKYIEWYKDFLEKMQSQKLELFVDFTEEAFNQVANTFTAILNKIKTGIWGGSICYVKLSNQHILFSFPSVIKNDASNDGIQNIKNNTA